MYRYFTRKSFTKKIILITGSAHGLGFSLARIFVNLNCEVILWDINEKLLTKAKDDLERLIKEKNLNSKVYTKIVDVSNYEIVTKSAQEIKDNIGNVNVLINNAGYISRSQLFETTPENIKTTFGVNVYGHFWTIKNFLPNMMKQNEGHVVCVCSMSGLTGIPGLEDYSTSKFASFGLAENVGMLMKKNNKNVDVLTVCPTLITTGFNKGCGAPALPYAVLSADDTAKIIYRAMRYRQNLLVIPSILGKMIWFFRLMFDTWVMRSLNHVMGGLDAMDKVYGINAKKK